ncbi:MAG TPA: GNAT family N-acetyltransferase [Longimicrobiales bacterium]|nr:GNAT family N-acetyltransferase [Longimicrobiales bacterium]
MTDEVRIFEIRDEREPMAEAALAVIADMFAAHERQPLAELRSELAERRLGMLSGYNFHLLTALYDDDETPAGTIAGLYLDGVNAGFITYLAVRRQHRGRRLARLLRPRLIEVFRADARREEYDDLAWVLGEVRADSPWLRRLVRTRGAIPFDIRYYHPGMSLDSDERYILYRQPIGDKRQELPVELVRRTLFAIYRRGYRVRYPLNRDIFNNMLEQLEGRDYIGVHPDYRELLCNPPEPRMSAAPRTRPAPESSNP